MAHQILDVKMLSCGDTLEIGDSTVFLYCLCENAKIKTNATTVSFMLCDAAVFADNISVESGEGVLAVQFCGEEFSITYGKISALYNQKSTAEKLFFEMTEKSELYLQNANALLTQLLVAFVRSAKNKNVSERAKKGEKILKYISEHYKEELTNSALGEIFGLHPNYISRLVSEQTGLSLHKYVLKLRIDEALRLLENTNLSAREISRLVGFCDYNHFLQYFKQITKRTTKSVRGQ